MDDDKEDPFRYKPKGHVQLKIEKLSELAREKGGRRQGEPVHVLGYKWKLFANVEEEDHSHAYSERVQKCLGLYLQCIGGDDEEEESDCWTCSVSATFKVLAQKQGKEDYVHELVHLFRANAAETTIGFQWLAFEELMNPNSGWSGWYDEANDSILLTVDFTANAPNGVSYISRKDVLVVNGEEVGVNKHHLAANSDYFERFFYGQEYKQNNELVLDHPANVEHFKRLLDTMQPQNRPLDDDCIEGVYHLANQFFLGEVEQKCRTFLSQKSTRSTIFKYRLANKYSFIALKKQILAESKKGEFSKEDDFLDNLEEYAKLDETARKELGSRIGQLFGKAKGSSAEEPPAKRARTST